MKLILPVFNFHFKSEPCVTVCKYLKKIFTLVKVLSEVFLTQIVWQYLMGTHWNIGFILHEKACIYNNSPREKLNSDELNILSSSMDSYWTMHKGP